MYFVELRKNGKCKNVKKVIRGFNQSKLITVFHFTVILNIFLSIYTVKTGYNGRRFSGRVFFAENASLMFEKSM